MEGREDGGDEKVGGDADVEKTVDTGTADDLPKQNETWEGNQH